jgi:tetraacyldisaccharide 4'-kinase
MSILALDNSYTIHKYFFIMRVAILSNSYGEDRSGALIGIEAKKLYKDIEIISFPLVSFGEEYKKRGIKVIGGSTPPPSGGFFLKSITGILRDLIEELTVPFNYIKILHNLRYSFDILIAVGDVTLLILGWLGLRMKSYFLAPCKSDWKAPHLWIEKVIMKNSAKLVFTHDELTALNLRKNGVNALFLGNPMMDELIEENRYNPPEQKLLIGILPGSREESYGNIKKIVEIINALKKRFDNIHFAVSVADTVDIIKMKKYIINLENDIDFITGAFIDILKNSVLVISLAGTATEQAVGLGIPVISFVGTGAQTTKRRLLGQKKLLGKSFKLMRYNPEDIADEIKKILMDEDLREEMRKSGRERMGTSGGARNIAKYILESEDIL